jgi:D-alanyl-D-alanine carboxypeptidase
VVTALLALLLAHAIVVPAGASATGSLPACRYDDVLTSPRGYDDWQGTLVDTILNVPSNYVPPDLVSVSGAGLHGDSKVRSLVIDDLRALQEAAATAGNPIGVESAYRSYSDQQLLFDSWVKQYGYSRALLTPARPGHSEHQLGVAIDFNSATPGAPSTSFGTSAAGKWMARTAWNFGFVMSYPNGLTATTCYGSEPWHFRYVGRALAAEIVASGLTVREYLWSHVTRTIVPPGAGVPGPPIAPVPTLASPSAGAGPTASPASTATAAPASTVAASMPPASTGTQPPTAAPFDGRSTVDAGQAVVGGALAILLASIAGVWLATRGRRR